jgi:hypothetical protein
MVVGLKGIYTPRSNHTVVARHLSGTPAPNVGAGRRLGPGCGRLICLSCVLDVHGLLIDSQCFENRVPQLSLSL